MITENLKERVTNWINKEVSGYRAECGNDYRYYLYNDCIEELAPDATPEEKEEISTHIRSILEG